MKGVKMHLFTLISVPLVAGLLIGIFTWIKACMIVSIISVAPFLFIFLMFKGDTTGIGGGIFAVNNIAFIAFNMGIWIPMWLPQTVKFIVNYPLNSLF